MQDISQVGASDAAGGWGTINAASRAGLGGLGGLAGPRA
jgi:hypothetical protein